MKVIPIFNKTKIITIENIQVKNTLHNGAIVYNML